MSSSRHRNLDELPAALPSMWRAVKRGFAAEPALLAIAFALSLIAALPDALMALWLKFLADGLLGGVPMLVVNLDARTRACPRLSI